ncbi:RTA1-domain-containing protein [Paraphaeosphaeria sporulosa]|uniref:RTA1-domain-containing protein n=1 Tax=Paraphaeosphaeria sporulosa TaxID=1460663 RepID=A0A177C6B2_9PLEO|nr:RTA1-domain-containing protein [Paraphaeosphaeria sporulosa]OAG03173.1 RTA1-domain-containing protein [Paraphaeosphaeria sporulosa]
MANPPKAKNFDWEMYRYIPSLAGAIISMIIFLILTLLLFWQWFRTRNHILIFVVIGTISEVIGYGNRIGSHFDNQAWGPFITQGTLLLVGPLFFAATIYMMLGRTIVLAGGEDVSLIRPRWYTRVFVGADIFTLVLQGLGTFQSEKIVIAGLALQVATFVFFLIAAIDFQLRMERKAAISASLGTPANNQWRKLLWILYTVSSLVLFRCIFRLIEYAMGNAAYLIAHEWTLYVFDTTPMFLTVALLLVLQPTRYVTKEYRKGSSDSGGEVQLGSGQAK